MKLFQINYNRLILLLLPVALRSPRLYALLKALMFPVSELHRRFLSNRDSNILRIRRNGQTCYLRGMLNDELDPELRRIRIEDAEMAGKWQFAYSEEQTEHFLVDANTLIYGQESIIEGTSFFIVIVPWSPTDVNLTNRLKSYLNEYKLLSKQYIIRYE